MRAGFALACGLAAAGTGTAGWAQDQPGNAVLANGLGQRVLTLSDGITIQRSGANVDAGYFRVKMTPVGLGNVVCPKVAFRKNANKQQWQRPDQQIYDIVFKRNVIWSITARVSVSAALGGTASQEIPLILIKNPNDSGCKISALVGPDDLPIDVSQASFLVPVTSANPVYGNEVQLLLSYAYTVEANKDRVEAAWTGIKTAAGVIAAPFGAVIGALSGQGTATLSDKLSKRAALSAPYSFPADPGGTNATAHFVYLGFEAGQPNAAAPTAGVRIATEYQASMFRPGRFYTPNVPLTKDEILSARPIRMTVGGALQDRSVRDLLPQPVWDGLAAAPNAAAFDSACSIAQPELRKIGLSDVDKDAFLWAAALSNPTLANQLRALQCLSGPVQQANLAKLGIKLPDPPPPPPQGERPKKDDMHAAMDNLVLMMRSASVNADLSKRFADKINVSLVDDPIATLPQAPAGLSQDRAAVLNFMAANFSRGGCYVPRDDDAELPLRPVAPLAPKARAGAMVVEAKGGSQYILSLGFDPAPPGEAPKISTMSIQSRGQSADAVVRELAKGTSDVCPKL